MIIVFQGYRRIELIEKRIENSTMKMTAKEKEKYSAKMRNSWFTLGVTHDQYVTEKKKQLDSNGKANKGDKFAIITSSY